MSNSLGTIAANANVPPLMSADEQTAWYADLGARNYAGDVYCSTNSITLG